MNHKILLMIFCLSSYFLNAQDDSQKPCSSPEARQFDFWVGEWKAEWTAEDGKKTSGSNTVKSIWDGCTIEENFDGTPGTPLIGKSYSVYNPAKKKWYQTWVDNSGGYIPFEGEWKDDKMILVTERTDKDGKKILMRMVWMNIKENEFDWHWERSDDGGNLWEPKWVIHYTRK